MPEHVLLCPMCGSPFDDRKFKNVLCVECSAEGSTACCVVDGETCYACLEDEDPTETFGPLPK